MPEFNEFLKVLMDQFLTNPVLQGAFVSLVVAQLRKVFKSLDAKAKSPEEVKKVQALVMVLSVAVSLLSAYASNSLNTHNPKELVDVIIVIISALGTHQGGQDVKRLLNNGRSK